MDCSQDEIINEDWLQDLNAYDRLMEIGKFKTNEEEAIITEDSYYHKLEDESYREY